MKRHADEDSATPSKRTQRGTTSSGPQRRSTPSHKDRLHTFLDTKLTDRDSRQKFTLELLTQALARSEDGDPDGKTLRDIDKPYWRESDADAYKQMVEKMREDKTEAESCRSATGIIKNLQESCKDVLTWLQSMPLTDAILTTQASPHIQQLLCATDAVYRSNCKGTAFSLGTSEDEGSFHSRDCLYGLRQSDSGMNGRLAYTFGKTLSEELSAPLFREEAYEGLRGDGSNFTLYGCAASAVVKLFEKKLEDETGKTVECRKWAGQGSI